MASSPPHASREIERDGAGSATPRTSRASDRGSGAATLRQRTRRVAVALIATALIIAAIFAFTELEWAKVRQAIGELDPVLLFLLMATLPVAGFSVGLVYLIAGARFGPLVGGALVAAATASHLLLTHWISGTFLREPLQRLLARRKHRLLQIDPGDEGSISLMAALVPGPPYFLRNYLLALSSVPLRTYFWICLPVYVARSYVTIFLGDLGNNPSRRTLLILALVYVVKLTLCAFLIARLRRRHSQREKKGPAPF